MRGHVFAVVAALTLGDACAALTPAEQASVAADAVAVSVCQSEAHDCHMSDGGASKCWGVYDRCMTVHGLRDAGVD